MLHRPIHKKIKKNIWIDEKGKDEKIKCSMICLGNYKLSVHHYIGCGDQLFASCYGIFDVHPLISQGIEDAKKEVISLLKERFESVLDGIKLIKEN